MTGVVVSLAPLETGGSLKCGVTPAVQLKRQARGFLNPTTVKVARCGSRESTLLNQRVKRRVNLSDEVHLSTAIGRNHL